jgi:hypothetical protein
MAKVHRSMRLDPGMALALDAMADHRGLDFTGMCATIFETALRAKQRACSHTHRVNTTCGECGLLLTEQTTNLEAI